MHAARQQFYDSRKNVRKLVAANATRREVLTDFNFV
jgi:hypothetical protein